MGKGKVEVRFEQVEVDALVVPADRVRHIGSVKGMEQLRQSIAERGVLVPLVVVEEGERYRVVCGCRRAMCAQSIGVATVPAMVVTAAGEWEAWAAYVENGVREQVNAVDEARWLERQLERLGGEQIRLAEVLGVSEGWVSQRLGILAWPEDVREALESGRLTFAVCREFAHIKSPAERALCIRQASSSGCSARQAGLWRRGAELVGVAPCRGEEGNAPPGAAPPFPSRTPPENRGAGTGAALPPQPPPRGREVVEPSGGAHKTEPVGKGTAGGGLCAACGKPVPVGEGVSIVLCSPCNVLLQESLRG